METAEQCRAKGADAWVFRADLAAASDVAALVSEVARRWGALDVLVNNASAFSPCRFEDLTDETWSQMLDVNLVAPFRLSRDLLPLLRASSPLSEVRGGLSNGVVVHLCDIGAERPIREHAHYSVSKAGLVMLVRAMAVELAPEVRTHGVSPGQVAWPPTYDEAKRTRLAARIPMGREGRPEDVANLIRFLVWEGHYLNGAIVPVDGGLSCKY
jgi:pteridine reductase